MIALLLPSLWVYISNFVKHVVASYRCPSLLDPPRYLQPYHLPLLPDVVSLRFFTHAAEYLVRISIVFQEIAQDSPDILTWGTTPDRGLIQEVGQFIDQRSLIGWLANLFTRLMMMRRSRLTSAGKGVPSNWSSKMLCAQSGSRICLAAGRAVTDVDLSVIDAIHVRVVVAREASGLRAGSQGQTHTRGEDGVR